MSISMAQ